MLKIKYKKIPKIEEIKKKVMDIGKNLENDFGYCLVSKNNNLKEKIPKRLEKDVKEKSLEYLNEKLDKEFLKKFEKDIKKYWENGEAILNQILDDIAQKVMINKNNGEPYPASNHLFVECICGYSQRPSKNTWKKKKDLFVVKKITPTYKFFTDKELINGLNDENFKQKYIPKCEIRNCKGGKNHHLDISASANYLIAEGKSNIEKIIDDNGEGYNLTTSISGRAKKQTRTLYKIIKYVNGQRSYITDIFGVRIITPKKENNNDVIKIIKDNYDVIDEPYKKKGGNEEIGKIIPFEFQKIILLYQGLLFNLQLIDKTNFFNMEMNGANKHEKYVLSRCNKVLDDSKWTVYQQAQYDFFSNNTSLFKNINIDGITKR